MLTQGKLEWDELLGLDGSARTISQERASLMSKEGAGRMAVQDRAMLNLAMEAAAARRRLQALQEPCGVSEGGVPGECGGAHPG